MYYYLQSPNLCLTVNDIQDMISTIYPGYELYYIDRYFG